MTGPQRRSARRPRRARRALRSATTSSMPRPWPSRRSPYPTTPRSRGQALFGEVLAKGVARARVRCSKGRDGLPTIWSMVVRLAGPDVIRVIFVAPDGVATSAHATCKNWRKLTELLTANGCVAESAKALKHYLKLQNMTCTTSFNVSDECKELGLTEAERTAIPLHG
jgi:hypothetical protein